MEDEPKTEIQPKLFIYGLWLGLMLKILT